jgi:hypothetical protein
LEIWKFGDVEMAKSKATFGRFVVTMAVVALACGTALAAQARAGKAKAPDAITGTWNGQLTAGERDRSIVLVLKFDGKTKVTGTFTGMPKPGDVKAGTFDAKTGALKLDLGIEGDSAVRLTLEGTVAGDKASGRVTGEATGEFTLAKADTRK